MLQANRFINAINADSKPVSLRASDGRAYVTKWIFGPRENRRLVNEWVAGAVLRYMGVNCADNAVIRVDASFIRQNRAQLQTAFGQNFANIQPGLVFASAINESAELVANQPPIEQIINLDNFHAALVADVFLCQGDKRQAIFERLGKHCYQAKFIDNANALESKWWQFKTAPNAIYPDKAVYRDLNQVGLLALVAKLQAMPRSTITDAVGLMPVTWLGDDSGIFEHVLQTLWHRQRNLPFLMQRFLQGEHADFFPTTLLQSAFRNAALRHTAFRHSAVL